MDKTDYWFNLELLVYWLLEDSTYLPDIGWTATDEDDEGLLQIHQIGPTS